MTTDQLITKTKELVAIPSTSDNPAALLAAVEFVAAFVAEQTDITIERFERGGRPSFLAYRGPIRPETFDILLNGHVDVIPARPEQFKATIKDGKMYGRGVLDMKGTTMVLADVFRELVSKVPYNLGLQIVSDEEIGGYDGVKLQIQEGVRANFVVMGEYSNEPHTIYNAARGLCWAEIAFKGKSAHGGHLWHGTNAVVKAGNFAGAILERYPTPDKEIWTTTASIANLTTPNVTYNKVPDEAVLKIDFRFTQEDPVFHSRESIETFIASIDPDATLVNLATFEPAVDVEELNPYVQGLSAAHTVVTGKKPHFKGRPGASDGRHYAVIGNDIVEFGLSGNGSHSDHEYVELASFGEYKEIMHAFLHKPIPDQLALEPGAEAPLRERLLATLVAMETVSSNQIANKKALEYVGSFLEARGMYVDFYEHNGFSSLIAMTKRRNKRPAVLLNAHIDVVPGKDSMFSLKTTKDKLVGRGVMDMKHAIAAYMTVVDNLKNELDGYDFGIMLTADEELGSNDGVRQLVAKKGYRPKVVIIPDGGNDWRIERFSKGVAWIKLEATGKNAHASRPWEGDSAINHLLAAIQEIKQLVPANPKPEETLLSVGTIQGGTTANQIPVNASATLDIRTGSVKDYQRLPGDIDTICKQHGVTATVLVNDPPCVTDPEHPLIKPMVEIVERITGQPHETCYDYAVTDGRLFAAAGVPTIVINPECGDIHSDHEWLSRTGFDQFCQAIEQYVRRMALAIPDQTLRRPQDIARLFNRLDGDKPAHIWYAAYGSGMSKANFLCQIHGGQVRGCTRMFAGCSDQTAPKRDHFLSLPYPLYFAGNCPAWGGGGHINILPEPAPGVHTVAHAYLITIEQFAEIAAQQNDREGRDNLPFKEAMQDGHATISGDEGHYDELVYCGTVDDTPVFSLTAAQPELPYTAPTPVYAGLLCKALSENGHADRQAYISYMLSIPGVDSRYKEQDIAQLFGEIEVQSSVDKIDTGL